MALADATRRRAISGYHMPILREVDSFDPQAFFAQAGAGRKITTYQKNQTIFEQGDVADTVFYIRKGRIKVEVQSEQGREAVVEILGPGHFFGERCMNGHRVQFATTRAMEESVVTEITIEAMSAMLDNDSFVSRLFITYLLKRSVRIEKEFIDHLFNSSEKRLARLLLLLATAGQNCDTRSIDLTISQETLAQMIGTTRSRVNFFMNKFRKLGFISYNGYGKTEVNKSLLRAVLRQEPWQSDE